METLKFGVIKIAHHLRALGTIAEDLGLISGIHIAVHNHSWNYSSMVYEALSGLL